MLEDDDEMKLLLQAGSTKGPGVGVGINKRHLIVRGKRSKSPLPSRAGQGRGI